LPVVGDCLGGPMGYLFHHLVIIHPDISLSDLPVIFQRPTIKLSGVGFFATSVLSVLLGSLLYQI
jgi:hypothetical protein